MIEPPPCLTIWLTCLGPGRSPSLYQHQDLPFELIRFIFVSSLKMTHLQSSTLQFLYLWAKFNLARTCLLASRDFFCCMQAPRPTSLKARLKVMYGKCLPFFPRSCFVVALAVLRQRAVTRCTPSHFSCSPKTFGCPPLCFSILPLISLLIWATKDWLIPSESATFLVESSLLSYTNAWCFNDSHNRGIEIQLTNWLSL